MSFVSDTVSRIYYQKCASAFTKLCMLKKNKKNKELSIREKDKTNI